MFSVWKVSSCWRHIVLAALAQRQQCETAPGEFIKFKVSQCVWQTEFNTNPHHSSHCFHYCGNKQSWLVLKCIRDTHTHTHQVSIRYVFFKLWNRRAWWRAYIMHAGKSSMLIMFLQKLEGEICDLVSVINHKINMICHQRLRKQNWS